MDHKVEEILEFIWTLREQGERSIEKLLATEEVADTSADMDTLRDMERNGLVRIDGDTITLTEEGEKHARSAVRRHRLAEMLLTEVLEMDEGAVEKHACSFEHSLSPSVTESICTLLGHPPACPHGLPIPRGRCCTRPRGEVKPIVRPLSELAIGDRARIIFILSKSHARVDKLSSLGIVPGSIIKLHQKRPAYVIEIGETTLAVDPEIIKEIYVKRVV